jgi:hypothetical protein
MSITTEIPLTERAQDEILCRCRDAAFQGQAERRIAAAEREARRAYAAAAIREVMVPILGKDLGRGLVFYRIRNRQYARLYVVPADPLTPPRERMRAIMRAVSQAGNTLLTTEQRQAWIVAGNKVLSRLRLTQGPLTWQTLFVKLNAVLVLAGRELLLWPSEPVRFGPNRAGAVVPSYENGQFRLAVKVAGPEVEDIMVFGEAPVGPKRKKLRHPVFLGLLPASAGGLSDITAQYVGRFGEPAPGRKVLIGVQQQVGGWKGRMKVLGEVVPARPAEAPRNAQTTRKGAGVTGELRELKELSGLSGLREFREVLEFHGVTPPGCQRATPEAPRKRPGGTPLCIA